LHGDDPVALDRYRGVLDRRLAGPVDHAAPAHDQQPTASLCRDDPWLSAE